MGGIQVEHRDGAAIVVPHGPLMGGDPTERLENTIEEVLKDGPGRLVLDFADVEHMNSVGMAAVIRAHAACRRLGIGFFVIRAPERIRDVFEVTRISSLGILKNTFEETAAG
jgi:anti-anti-sigma factor